MRWFKILCPLYWPFGLLFYVLGRCRTNWLFRTLPKHGAKRVAAYSVAAIQPMLNLFQHYVLGQRQQAESLERVAKTVEQQLDSGNLCTDVLEAGDIQTPEALMERARELEEAANRYKQLADQMEAHLTRLRENPSHIENKEFLEDSAKFTAALRVVLVVIGPAVLGPTALPATMGYRLLMIFPFASIVGKILGWCLTRFRRKVGKSSDRYYHWYSRLTDLVGLE